MSKPTNHSPARRGDTLPVGYHAFLAEVKARIVGARTRALLAVNSELIQLYWEIGHEILAREQREGWGAKVIDHLAADLRREFSDMTGLSPRNLKYMRAFAQAWPAKSRVDHLCNSLLHNCPGGTTSPCSPSSRTPRSGSGTQRKPSKTAGPERPQAQIATNLRGRQGAALTSFDHALPAPDSELVRDAIKDPYNFEFLALSQAGREQELETALLNDVQSFLMEMGRGFALAGRQFPLRIIDEETGQEDEFFVDLLFYNYLLRRFVVIDLKVEDFKPEFTGKMSFYLTAVDELERQPGDEPSIGLVLCPGRSKTVTEWALRGIDSPVAIARYTTGEVTLTQTPPPEMKPALPDLPALASELSDIVEAANAIYDEELTEDRVKAD